MTTSTRPRWIAHLAWALPLLFTLAAGVALYAPNLRLALVGDDIVFAHRAMTQPLPQWIADTGGLPFYRPLSRQLYFEAMGSVCGTSPLPYHLVNLALTLACASLLFAFAFLEAGPVAGATAALVLLAQHGLSVATGWASCVQDLGALLFTLLALHAGRFARFRRAAVYVALALLCKETGAIAAALVVMAAWQWADAHAPARTWRERAAHARLAWPAVAVVGVWALAYALVFRRFPGAPADAATVDISFAPSAIAHAFAFSGATLVNIESGLSAALDGIDLLRLAAAVVCAAVALAVAGQLSREWRHLVGARAHPLRDGDEGLVALGLVWMLCALPLVLSVGHRPNTYHTLPLGAGFAVLLSGLFARRRFAASVVVGALVATGPLADAQSGGSHEPAVHSATSLPRLRRLSAFSTSLRDSLRAHHATLAPGTTVLLENVPELSLTALHGDEALQVWYRDPSLHAAFLHENAVPSPGPLCVLTWTGATPATPAWHEWPAARVAERERVLAAAQHAAWARQTALRDSLPLAAQWTRRSDDVSAIACAAAARATQDPATRDSILAVVHALHDGRD